MRSREQIETQLSGRNPQMQSMDATVQDVQLEVLLDIRDLLEEERTDRKIKIHKNGAGGSVPGLRL
jgi:hypothetical protein